MMKILCVLLTVVRQELYIIYIGSHSVRVAEEITALYQREGKSISKYSSALHERHGITAGSDLSTLYHYLSYFAIHTGNL